MSLTNWDLLAVRTRPPAENGLFARVIIREGAFLGCFDGRATTFPASGRRPSAVLGQWDHKEVLQLHLNEECLVGLVPVDPFDGIDFANHSCKPNCRVIRGVILIAARDIDAGEEITFDYRTVDLVPEGIACWCKPSLCQI